MTKQDSPSYPDPIVAFAHSSMRCFEECRHLSEFIATEDGLAQDVNFVKSCLDDWLDCWTRFGMLLRVGGYDYVLRAHPLQPKPPPVDMNDAVSRSLRACNKLQGHLRDDFKESSTITSFLEKIDRLSEALAAVDQELGE